MLRAKYTKRQCLKHGTTKMEQFIKSEKVSGADSEKRVASLQH